jgi:hypothetical protein
MLVGHNACSNTTDIAAGAPIDGALNRGQLVFGRQDLEALPRD